MKRGTLQSQSRRQVRSAAGPRHRHLRVETLEGRRLLAAAIGSGGPPTNEHGWVDNVAPRNVGAVTAFQFQERETLSGRGLNDSIQTAELLPLGTLPGQQNTIDVRGNLPPFQSGGIGGTQFEDVDFYAVDLRAGDILDIAGTNAVRRIDVLYSNGSPWFGTMQNMGQAAGYPANSPLQTLGNAVAAQVVPEDGRYYVRASGGGPGAIGGASYTLGLRVYRPVLEQQPVGTQQAVYLDFEGGLVPRTIFPGLDDPANPLPATLQFPSLLESLNYLGFDLPIIATPESEGIINTLLDDIIERVDRHFNQWVPQTGGNGNYNVSGTPGEFGIRILNSRDHADPGYHAPNVTRVFVGGATTDIGPDLEGLYGASQGIDVGNFDTSAVVFTLLDAIGLDAQNVDDIPTSMTATRLEVAAQGIALTVSHELAHSFGIWHTDRAGNIPSIIDANVEFIDDYELGPDGIFGTPDDRPIPFPERDRFNPVEGMTGMQRVTASLAWGLATGTQGTAVTGMVFNDLNRDRVRSGAGEVGLGGITVFVDNNGNGQLDSGELSTTTAADGSYSLTVGPGNNQIAALAPAGFVFTTSQVRSVSGATSGVNFGIYQPNPQVTGRKFADLNGNGFADPGEPGIADVFIYIDLDGDDRIDLGEPRARTDADGNYTLSFAGLPAGTYSVREVVGAGYEQTAPAGGAWTITYDGITPPTGLDFGNRPSRDFGDAPDSYSTLQASGGPSHGIVPGLSLGQRVDADLDGQPSPRADADDLNGPLGSGGQVLDDEDGVRLLTPLAPGATATFEVTISNSTGQNGYLQAWFDFNQNGAFNNTSEKAISNQVLAAGVHQISIDVPEYVQPGDLVTRWRYSLTPDLSFGGAANTGEVEDHLFIVQPQADVANDDQVSVSRNTQANPINVLANDFETAENRLRITAIDRFALSTRGAVTIAADGRSVFYTPPTGFVGQDRFTYTVTPEVGPPETATVTVNVTFQSDAPIALDDSFEVAQGSNNIALNVLDNDLPSSHGGITIVSVTPGTEGGTTSLAGGNQSVRYTPRPGFAGTEEFTYTISDAAGNISSAKATINLLPGSRNDDVVGFEIEFLDVVNNQPLSDIQAGDEFLARVTVEDLRSPLNQTGIFSAFLDLLYTDELVAVVPDATNPLGFDIRFGSQFQSGFGLQSGDTDTPGLLNEVGSQRPVIGMAPEDNEGPLELFSVRFQAISPGIAVFAANPADEPVSETTVYGRMTALNVRELRLGTSELVISPAGTSFTSAVDDAYPDGRDSLGNRIRGGAAAQLDVLANDLLGATGTISEFFLVSQPDRGVAQVNGGLITYTPDSSTINQFDSFTYAIVTADGIRSTAEVTLFVGDPIEAQNTAPVGAKPFDVDITLRVVDGAGNPINQVSAGSRFGVQVVVEDLRAALAAEPLGVFAAFTDILYDANLALPSNQIQGDPFDFDVVFSPAFGVNGAFGIADRPGIIDEFGSFLTNTNPGNVPPNPALTGDPVVMATLYFDAIGTGALRLTTSPADALPFRDTLLFQPPAPVPIPRIRYNVTTVNIGGAAGEGEFRQNALLPADVNGDGVVTPIDALLIINSLARQRGGAAGETLDQRPTFYTDVNGDREVTPLDALQVINHIAKGRRGESPIDLTQLSALTPSAGGIVSVQSHAALTALLSQRYAAEFDAPEGEAANLPAPQDFASAEDEQDDALLSLLADDVAQLWQ